MRRRTQHLVAGVAALAGFATGCGPDQSDDERRAQWEANEPRAYAYWFHWGDMEEPGYSTRVEIVDGDVVRTDLGPGSRRSFHGPEAPTIDDVFALLDQARADASDAEKPRLDVDFDDDLGFPTDVHFSDRHIADWSYAFGVAGFEVSEARRPDG